MDCGARGRNRTADTMIFSHVLYQLSYPGVASAAVRTGERWSGAYGEGDPPWQAPNCVCINPRLNWLGAQRVREWNSLPPAIASDPGHGSVRNRKG